MNFIIYGEQSVMIKNRLKKVVKERLDFVDEMNFVKFDMANTSLLDVIEEASYMPLGYDHKIIVLEDALFLEKTKVTKGKKKINDNNEEIEKFINYLKHPNEDTDLILTLNSVNIDKTSDIYKLLVENGKVYELLSVDKKDLPTYIYRYFNETLNTKIDRDAIDELASRIKGDLNIFVNEANKLSLYTNHVRYEDVIKLVNKPLDENAFEMFNFLMGKRNGDAIKLFRDLCVNSVEPVTLISLLSNQFRLLYQIIYLAKSGYTNEQIAKELNIKEGRVYILKKYMYTMSMKEILATLDTLFKLDYNIKSGQVDRIYAFEMFLINFQLN